MNRMKATRAYVINDSMFEMEHVIDTVQIALTVTMIVNL